MAYRLVIRPQLSFGSDGVSHCKHLRQEGIEMKKCTAIGIFLLISGLVSLQILALPALANALCVGTGQYGVAFDGSNIWVANNAKNTVQKLRASDGSLLGTYPVAGPWGIAFDGENIWVTNYDNKTVTKLNAGDGSLIGTYTVGTTPTGIAFDGSNIWVTNLGSNTVTKLCASDGSLVGTYSVDKPWGIAYDGSNIWVTNYGSKTVTKLKARDGHRSRLPSLVAAPRGSTADV